ncbi:apolipoprotein N-acyltransferase [soil metagenome]
MNFFSRLKYSLPTPLNAGLAAISAILLILAFPDFEFWFLALFALVPLFFAIEREKESWRKSFFVGWTFGTIFFFGTCYWLTHAPITYAGFPWLIAYILMFFVALTVGIFPAIFGALFSILLKRFGSYAILSAPFLWVFTEFLRYWLTGNNWNAIGYSQAFHPFIVKYANLGGVSLVSFIVCWVNSFVTLLFCSKTLPTQADFDKANKNFSEWQKLPAKQKFYIRLKYLAQCLLPVIILQAAFILAENDQVSPDNLKSSIIAVQPNVPMNGLNYEKYQLLLQRHIELAETALKQRKTNNDRPTIVIFPESPMIFQYGRDRELQEYLKNFAVRNNASVLFNSAEMTANGNRAFNSAVMINERGEKTAQYDKIHLLPFGEFIPFPEPIASQMPAFVGNFEFGNEYDLLPFGDAKAGVMICFESHFGELSREYAKRGADVLIEMTNDGYLGNTPVLRQHLANSVFRAVETNRPVLRVTNVGVTAYINERGEISNAAEVYTEATRIWTVSKSDGKQTIYVRYGDWFAWLCSLFSLALLFLSCFWKKSYIYDAKGRKVAMIRQDSEQ